MLRIDERSHGRGTTLALSGCLTTDYISELEGAIARAPNGGEVVLNLANLKTVDREGLAFLARVREESVRLEDCPPYIRRWMTQEQHKI